MRTEMLRLLAVLLLSAPIVACQPQYDPPSLVNKLRVLGIRATPPQVRIGGETDIEALVAGFDETKTLCHAWAFCPIAIPLNGRFQCIDAELFLPLGTAATAKLTSQQVQEAIDEDKLNAALAKHGFELPARLKTGKTPDIEVIAKQLAAFEFYVMFKIATVDEFGGTCPTDIAKTVQTRCEDRNRCLQGYKRVSLALLPQYFHSNPKIDAVELVDVMWPEAVTPTVVPYDEPPDAFDAIVESGLDAELFDGYGPTALKVKPVFSKDSRELIPEVEGEDGTPAKEELLISWFVDHGKLQKNRTWHAFPDNLLLPPAPEKGVSKRTISVWIVVRDGRNGTDWVHRRITVDPAASATDHPLCTLDKTLAGCENVTPKG